MSGSVVVTAPDTTVVVAEQERSVVLTRGIEGPRGPQGEPGPAGGATLVKVGDTPISGHAAVAMDTDGRLVYADCTSAAQIGTVMGLTTSAYAANADAVVQQDFEVNFPGWAFVPGPVFVGEAGALVQSLPPAAVFQQVVAFALTATRIRVFVQPPLILS